jgi:hypothetical protein
MKNDMHEERQQRFPVVHRRHYDLAGKEQLGQGDEVENHPQAGSVQRDAAEQVAGAGERHEGVDQPDKVAPQCETQPKQRHRPYELRNPVQESSTRIPVPESAEFTANRESGLVPGTPLLHVCILWEGAS